MVSKAVGWCIVVAGLFFFPAIINAESPSTKAEPATDDDLLRGQSLLDAEDYPGAIRAFKKANAKQDSKCGECYWGLVRAYTKLGAFKDVIGNSDKLQRYASTDFLRAQAHNMKGVGLFSLAGSNNEKLWQAEQEFREAIKLDPTADGISFNLGVALLRQRFDDQGISVLNQYLKAFPNGRSVADAHRYIENPRRAREPFAPIFSATSSRGEYIDLEELKGKVVLLDFWATWCPPCVNDVHELRKLYAKLPKDQFVLLSIALDRDKETWHKFVQGKQMDWPQIFDEDHRLHRLFNVYQLPTYILLDGDGLITNTFHDVRIEREIQKRIRSLTTLTANNPPTSH